MPLRRLSKTERGESMSPELVNAVVGIGSALVGAIAGWLLSRRSEERRRLLVRRTEGASIATVSKGFQEKIELRLNGNPVMNPGATEIRVKNAGNRALAEVNIRLTVTSPGSILTGHVIEEPRSESPSRLAQVEGGAWRLNIPLLNPREVVRLRFLTSPAVVDIDALFRREDVEYSYDVERAEQVAAMFEMFQSNVLLNLVGIISSRSYRERIRSDRTSS